MIQQGWPDWAMLQPPQWAQSQARERKRIDHPYQVDFRDFPRMHGVCGRCGEPASKHEARPRAGVLTAAQWNASVRDRLQALIPTAAVGSDLAEMREALVRLAKMLQELGITEPLTIKAADDLVTEIERRWKEKDQEIEREEKIMGAPQDMHAVGFRPPDDRWKEMKMIYDACEAADIEPPREVTNFFDGEEPDDAGVEIDLTERSDAGGGILVVAATPWEDDMREGYEIDLRKLPKDLIKIRVYMSY